MTGQHQTTGQQTMATMQRAGVAQATLTRVTRDDIPPLSRRRVRSLMRMRMMLLMDEIRHAG